jgi:putative nucleotidyltransferase with HDIG domain
MCMMSTESRESPAKMPPGLANVPAFPAVAIKLLPLFADRESSVDAIVACVAMDPALSGRLIKRANTADQLCYCESRSILQAVLTLGIDRTREITLAIAASIFANSAIQSEVLRPCWNHTLACALAAAEVARQCGLRPDETYTAALLHDIGRLGLVAAYPAEYEKIMAEADRQSGDLLRIERERFGVDHVEAGVWLARQWNLPESIVEVIARHHEKPTGKLDQAAVVQVACRLADLLGFGVNRPTNPSNFDEISAMLLAWTRSKIGAELRTVQDTIVREIRLFEGSEAPPLGSPGVIVDDQEPEEGGSTCGSPREVSTRMTTLLYSHRMIAGGMLAAIIVLFSAALFLRR